MKEDLFELNRSFVLYLNVVKYLCLWIVAEWFPLFIAFINSNIWTKRLYHYQFWNLIFQVRKGRYEEIKFRVVTTSLFFILGVLKVGGAYCILCKKYNDCMRCCQDWFLRKILSLALVQLIVRTLNVGAKKFTTSLRDDLWYYV